MGSGEEGTVHQPSNELTRRKIKKEMPPPLSILLLSLLPSRQVKSKAVNRHGDISQSQQKWPAWGWGNEKGGKCIARTPLGPFLICTFLLCQVFKGVCVFFSALMFPFSASKSQGRRTDILICSVASSANSWYGDRKIYNRSLGILSGALTAQHCHLSASQLLGLRNVSCSFIKKEVLQQFCKVVESPPPCQSWGWETAAGLRPVIAEGREIAGR